MFSLALEMIFQKILYLRAQRHLFLMGHRFQPPNEAGFLSLLLPVVSPFADALRDFCEVNPFPSGDTSPSTCPWT